MQIPETAIPDSISLFDLVRWSPLHLLVPLLIIQRIAEMRLSKKNGKLLLAKGAKEFGAEHYSLIVTLHVLWFAGICAEVLILSRQISPWWPLFLGLFLLGQAIRYWAIKTLGWRWNTRIYVLPGTKPVTGGPYRFFKHPNYVAVIIELLTFPLIFSATVTAITGTIINGIILWIRIGAEEKALTEFGRGYERVGSKEKPTKQEKPKKNVASR